MIDLNSLNEQEKTLLFVVGKVDLLIAHGLLAGESPALPRAVAFYDQVHASGFRPQESEVRHALRAMAEKRCGRLMEVLPGDFDALVLLILKWEPPPEPEPGKSNG